MEKFIGQEYTDPQEREQFLKDNADAIEKMGYSKPIPSDQVEKLKETLADAGKNRIRQPNVHLPILPICLSKNGILQFSVSTVRKTTASLPTRQWLHSMLP